MNRQQRRAIKKEPEKKPADNNQAKKLSDFSTLELKGMLYDLEKQARVFIAELSRRQGKRQ